MKPWKGLVALAVAGALVAGTAWAQTSSGDRGTPPASQGKTETSPDATKSDSSGTKSSEMKGSGADMKSSDTKSSDMKNGLKSEKRGARAARGAGSEQVKAAQQALKDKGHDPGDIDGKMGPKTRIALKEFQKAEGLKDTGRLDADTMSKLGMAGGKMGAAGGSSPAASPSTSGEKSSSTDSSSSPSASSDRSGARGSAPSASPSTPSTPAPSEKPAGSEQKQGSKY